MGNVEWNQVLVLKASSYLFLSAADQHVLLVRSNKVSWIDEELRECKREKLKKAAIDG